MSKLCGRFTKSKGQGLTVLMVALIMSSMISGLVAVALVENLPAIYGGYVDDASLISETEYRHDNIIENYIPLAVHYSVAQASWEVGTNEETLYGVQNESSDGMNWSDEIYPEYEDIIQDVDQRSDDRFRDYVKDLNYPNCRISMLEPGNMNVDPQWESADGMEKEIEVQATNDADGIVNTSCGNAYSHMVNYTGKTSFIRVPIVNNKFPQLATLTVGAIAEMENVSEQLDTDLDDGEVSDTSACYATKSTAKDNVDAKAAAEDKVAAFITALVDEDHGIGSGSGDRGAREYLKSKTENDDMCFIICAPNWLAGFNDVPIRDISVENKDVAYADGDSKTTSQCGCDDFDCTDSGYTYDSFNDECDATDTPYPEPNCDNPDVTDPSTCDDVNLTCDSTSDSSEVLYHGDDTTLNSNDNCEPKNSEYPSPTCVDKRWEASETHKYDIDNVRVAVSLVDDKDGREIPTDDGFKHPVVNRTFSRDYTTAGDYESVN